MQNTWREKMEKIRQSKFNSLLRVLAVVLLVLVALGSYSLYKFIWPTPYVARQSGFQIVFPGNPSVYKLPAKTESGVKVSGDIYSVDNQMKGTDYAVYATNYTGVNFDTYSQDAKLGALEEEVSTVAKNDELSISDGQTHSFKNMAAVEATLKPSNPSEPSTYAVAFLNKDKIYILLGAGITPRQFNIYTKTFRFVN
jgi:hypothetical protein